VGENHRPPIFQTVPADEFTDREEIIGRLVRMAALTPRDITVSTSLVGRRRLGKTAVLEQVYNRLFWEQDAVVPIYFVFEDKPVTSTEFAEAYFTNFLRQFIAFRRKDDGMVRERRGKLPELVQMARELGEESLIVRAEIFLDFRENVEMPGVLHQLIECAIHGPRHVMEYNRGKWLPETPIFVMLDEFQEVMKIYYTSRTPADAVGMFQWAVEGRKCPHLVTGSAIRLINQEVLGTGALFGRFRYIEFPPLEDIFGLELVDRLAHKHNLTIQEPVAGYLVARCAGSPFYINCVISQAVERGLGAIVDEAMVNELIAYEISHGAIWRDWSGQLQRYFEQLNSHFIAKRVLFHAAQAGDEIIEPELIVKEVGRPVDEVQRVLHQLAFADMIDTTGGYILRNLKDPILREFIRVQYQLDVAQQPLTKVLRELQAELARWQRKYAESVGQLVEARITALMHRFDGRRVAGRLFGIAGEVELPKFAEVYDTVVKGLGDRLRQADVVASHWHGGKETLWVVEIKHWARRVDAGIVREFADLCHVVGQEARVPPERVVKWLVNHVLSEAEGAGGFTEGALTAMTEVGILHSGAAEINELLRGFGISRLLEPATWVAANPDLPIQPAGC
jgi:hypothetical protein